MKRLAVTAAALALTASVAHAEDWQALANQATDALKDYRARVTVVDGTQGMYRCKGANITLGTKGNTKWLLAHELGHHLTGSCDESLMAEEQANAAAIRVLQVWGMTEEEAYRATANHLLNLKKLRGDYALAGHDYCEELRDLMKRFPQYPPKDPEKLQSICPRPS